MKNVDNYKLLLISYIFDVNNVTCHITSTDKILATTI